MEQLKGLLILCGATIGINIIFSLILWRKTRDRRFGLLCVFWLGASVVYAAQGATVAISVSDGGAGVAPKIRDKLFQPFVTTKDIGQGTGLGLSIFKALAESNGGALSYNDQSRNTAFVLAFPKFA